MILIFIVLMFLIFLYALADISAQDRTIEDIEQWEYLQQYKEQRKKK